MKKKNMIFNLVACSAGALAIGVAIPLIAKSVNLSMNATGSGDWVHYEAGDATEYDLATKEYWVECGGNYQFEAPATGSIREGGNAPDTSEFAVNDDRWDATQRLTPYSFNRKDSSTFCGASMYNITGGSDVTWRMTGTGADRLDANSFWSDTAMNFNLYGGNLFKWQLPKMNFVAYTHIYTYVQIHNWTGGNIYIGFNENDVTYKNVPGIAPGAPQAILEFTSNGSVVNCSLRVDGYSEVTCSYGAADFLLGRESLCLYAQAEGTGDGHFSMANFTCEAENYINYGSVTQVGTFSNAIQPILSTGGFRGTLQNLANGDYHIDSVGTLTRITEGQEHAAGLTGGTDLARFDGTQITFNEWWLRRLFDIHGSFWADGDVLVINGDFINAEGFVLHINTSCIKLTVADGALTALSMVKQ